MSAKQDGKGILLTGDDSEIRRACEQARGSFKYFWREISWERRRIVPAFEMMLIKLSFTDGERTDGNPETEHMWVDQVEFDGETLSGVLMNAPNWLTSVKQGDAVTAPFAQLEDWMIVAEGKAYGAFTVNQMRSTMSRSDRKAHDAAWGLDFGDPAEIRVNPFEESTSKPGLLGKIFGRKQEPKPASDSATGHQDTRMCLNMLPKIEEQLQEDKSHVTWSDENGWTMLHMEALAGNFGAVKLLVKHGADVKAKTNKGKDAIELAEVLGWEEIAEYLQNRTR